jgi:preprotein translocase subunit SecF
MEFFSNIPHINFMGLRRYTAAFSIFIILGSFIALAVNGLNLGLDFTGGTQMEMSFKQPTDLGKIRSDLQSLNLRDLVVQNFGSSQNILLSMPPQKDKDVKSLNEQILALLPGAELKRTDYVGPKIGKELASSGLLALVASMIGTMIYIMLRFEYRFAISSTLALIHDPVFILGVFSLFHIPFDLITLGALLAVIGYSLNDTIVVFDRVRESFRRVRKGTPTEIMNLSINQTLSRTVMTSGLALIAVIALYLFGGETLKGFSLAFILGIIIGTYSSIYVAGAVALAMGLNRQDLLPKAKSVFEGG